MTGAAGPERHDRMQAGAVKGRRHYKTRGFRPCDRRARRARPCAAPGTGGPGTWRSWPVCRRRPASTADGAAGGAVRAGLADNPLFSPECHCLYLFYVIYDVIAGHRRSGGADGACRNRIREVRAWLLPGLRQLCRCVQVLSYASSRIQARIMALQPSPIHFHDFLEVYRMQAIMARRAAPYRPDLPSAAAACLLPGRAPVPTWWALCIVRLN